MTDGLDIVDLKDALKGSINSLLQFIGSELKQVFLSRISEYQESEYKRNRFSKTILHRSEPKSLEEFYQPLFIREVDARNRNTRKTTKLVSKLFSKEKQITLIGFAGSGKSTLVKYLITRCFIEGFKIPVRVELRYLNDYSGSLKSYIVNEIVKFNKIGFTDAIIERMFESDNFLFFFDGYDEINSTKKQSLTNEIDIFVNRYAQNYYLITSRPNTNIEMMSTFKNYFICDLENNEINDFVKKQIPKEETELADKITSAIAKRENSNYKTFLSNPLLLSMFILTFQTYSAIPQRRSEFYNQVFNALFSLHDSMSKMAYVREKQSGLTKELFEEILRIFSYISFFEQEYIFTSQYINMKFNEIKNRKQKFTFDNDKLIEDMQVAIGILNKEGLDYTFPHRSLQEYFAACYVEKLSSENKHTIYKKLVDQILKGYQALLEKDHFFSLLAELDYKNFHKLLTIPLLQDLSSKLVTVLGTTDLTDNLAYLTYMKVFLISRVLMKDCSCSDLFEKIILEKLSMPILSDNELEESTFLHILSTLPMGEIKLKVIAYKNVGQQLIERLTLQIDDIDKSDGDIINLVAL